MQEPPQALGGERHAVTVTGTTHIGHPTCHRPGSSNVRPGAQGPKLVPRPGRAGVRPVAPDSREVHLCGDTRPLWVRSRNQWVGAPGRGQADSVRLRRAGEAGGGVGQGQVGAQWLAQGGAGQTQMVWLQVQ